ncbi:hypothetical protein NC651_031114 [Populus alba x Populus x berolinensis]|nr:hypothetical protein NC651_031114 [Populus alba x Populus x berolinensis]
MSYLHHIPAFINIIVFLTFHQPKTNSTRERIKSLNPLFLMNEYWKFLQFLPHPSLLSFNLLRA